MARVSTYLNFDRKTEEAFIFYRSVFGGEFDGPIGRMGDVPADPEHPEYDVPDANKDLVMHVALPILGGHMLMGTDAPDWPGYALTFGNNVAINLEPDTRAETEKLFAGLSDGGTVETPLQEMFWGDYFGSCADKYGVRWMFNCTEKAA